MSFTEYSEIILDVLIIRS